MNSNLKRGGDADAASSATKRASLGSDSSPSSTDIKKFEMPVFNMKRFIPFKWREMIPSGGDRVVEGFPFSTQEPHMRRVFEFALRAHQAVKCPGSSAKPEKHTGTKGGSLCAFCSAAGADFSFKGDSSRKSISLSLYAEVMKTYVPCVQDCVASFPVEEADLAIGDTTLTKLDITGYFFDGRFPMWYCSKRYPELPKAIEEMDAFQRYLLGFDDTRSKDAAYIQERCIALDDLKELQATQKAEFCRLLKQISISSRLDLALHNLSVMQPDKPKGSPRLSASQDNVSEIVKFLQPHVEMSKLSAEYLCTKVSNGKTQLIEDVIECLQKDPRITRIIDHVCQIFDEKFQSLQTSFDKLIISNQAVQAALEQFVRENCLNADRDIFEENETIASGPSTTTSADSILNISNEPPPQPQQVPTSSAICRPLRATPSCGLKNGFILKVNGKNVRSPGTKLCCPYNSLLQAWFYIKYFRKAVLCSKSDDVTLSQLKRVFQFLESRHPESNVEVCWF